jgi:hypothetical protein
LSLTHIPVGSGADIGDRRKKALEGAMQIMR